MLENIQNEMAKCFICESTTPFTIENAAPEALCTNCWEVMNRIDRFLRHEKGKEIIKKKLGVTL